MIPCLQLQPGFGSLASTEGKLTPSVFDGSCPEEERSQSAPSIMPASRFRLWQQLAALWWKFQSILSGLRLMAPDLFWWACNFSFNFNTFSFVDRALRNILWLRWRCIGGCARANQSASHPHPNVVWKDSWHCRTRVLWVNCSSLANFLLANSPFSLLW